MRIRAQGARLREVLDVLFYTCMDIIGYLLIEPFKFVRLLQYTNDLAGSPTQASRQLIATSRYQCLQV
jgi:hypothetical protein